PVLQVGVVQGLGLLAGEAWPEAAGGLLTPRVGGVVIGVAGREVLLEEVQVLHDEVIGVETEAQELVVGVAAPNPELVVGTRVVGTMPSTRHHRLGVPVGDLLPCNAREAIVLLPEPEALPELARVRRRRGVARQAGLPPPIAWKRQDGHTSDHDRNLAEAAVDPTEMAARSRQAQGALRFFATQ